MPDPNVMWPGPVYIYNTHVQCVTRNKSTHAQTTTETPLMHDCEEPDSPSEMQRLRTMQFSGMFGRRGQEVQKRPGSTAVDLTAGRRYTNLQIGVALRVAAAVLLARVESAVGIEINVKSLGRRRHAPLGEIHVGFAGHGLVHTVQCFE